MDIQPQIKAIRDEAFTADMQYSVMTVKEFRKRMSNIMNKCDELLKLIKNDCKSETSNQREDGQREDSDSQGD